MGFVTVLHGPAPGVGRRLGHSILLVMDCVPFVSMSAGPVYRTSEVATYAVHDDICKLVSGWVSPSQFRGQVTGASGSGGGKVTAALFRDLR